VSTIEHFACEGRDVDRVVQIRGQFLNKQKHCPY
jgi:hypothetical protein